MALLKHLLPFFIFVSCTVSSNAQQADSSLAKLPDTSKLVSLLQQPLVKIKPAGFKPFIVPAAMIAYGLIAIKSPALLDVNEFFKRKFWSDNPHNAWHGDNYLQFAPAAAVYALNIVGVHGKNNFRDRSMIYFISNIFLNVTVTSVKSLTKEERPDGSSNLSFPSGHTAEAFASAEFLRQEYKDVSGWYGVAGYATATATGMLRMYNNKHWLSDVIAGAGVGIASTKLAYIVYPAIRKLFFKNSVSHTVVMPYYQNKAAGLSMLYNFH